jgi:hypothetical protein
MKNCHLFYIHNFLAMEQYLLTRKNILSSEVLWVLYADITDLMIGLNYVAHLKLKT